MSFVTVAPNLDFTLYSRSIQLKMSIVRVAPNLVNLNSRWSFDGINFRLHHLGELVTTNMNQICAKSRLSYQERGLILSEFSRPASDKYRKVFGLAGRPRGF